MLNTILFMSSIAAIFTIILCLLRPLLKRKTSASARAVTWCVVLALSLIPIRLTLPYATPAPIPSMRQTVEAVIPTIPADAETSVNTALPVLPATPPVYSTAATTITPPSLEVSTIAPIAPTERAFEQNTQNTQNMRAVGLEGVLTAIWITGAAVIMFWGVMSYSVLQRKLKSSRKPARTSDISVLETLPHKIKLYRSEAAPTPLLLGVIAPSVYLPDRDYDDDALKNILIHELAHFRRRDVLIKWLALFANAVHWFNPAMYILRRELARECELAADEAVLCKSDKNARADYANMLLDMASSQKISTLSSAALSYDAGGLKERLENIMKFKKRTWVSAVLSIVFVAVVAIAAIASTAERAQDTDIGEYYGYLAASENEPASEYERVYEPFASETSDENVYLTERYAHYTYENVYQSTYETFPEYITILGQQFSTSLEELHLDALMDALSEVLCLDTTPLDTICIDTLFRAYDFDINFFNRLTNEDIQALRYMTNLTSLTLAHAQISDLTPLAGLTNLTHLDIRFGGISNITPLAGLTNPESLILDNNQIRDISPLTGLTNLQALNLGGNPLNDISPIAGLTNLGFLELRETNVSDITLLADFTNLMDLGLGGTFSDITPLASLTDLRFLALRTNRLSDITPLESLVNLYSLEVSTSPVSDITVLTGLTNLRNLWLWDNEISDITPLAGLINLENLCLGYNQVQDLTPLSGLTNLSFLRVEGNPVTDLSPVEHVETVWNRY